jgi:C4-dicarboxylate transporter DctM subunit
MGLMVLYSVSTSNSVGDMLLAGLIPGILMAIAMMVVTIIISIRRGYGSGDKFSLKRVLVSFKESIWALLTPVTILGGIYSGIFTPTEAAAFSCLYAIIVGMFIYKELTFKALMKCLFNSIKGTGVILSIVAVTQLFSWIMTREGLPQQIALLSSNISDNPQVFMLLITVVLLIVGMFLDPVPAVLIFAPILTPSAIAMGIDPIHFGVVMVATFCIGLVTPPVGMTLFVASNISKRPVLVVGKKAMPFIFAMLVAILLIIFIPQISLFLPSLGK